MKNSYEDKALDFLEFNLEVGGDYSAAWCEVYYSKKALVPFYNALSDYAEKYDKPLHYEFDSYVTFDFSPFTGTGHIDIKIKLESGRIYIGYPGGYIELTVQTDITEMDNFIRRIGKMLNGNTEIAYLGSKRGRFI
jgi:CRISPR/Cas system CSM-associated protein Csm5 (group 7 of RAMP superfamily)